jgi:integrase
MVGRIRTKEKCPYGGKFVEGRKGLVCPECQRTPRRYFLDIPQLGPNRKIYSESTGYPFDSYERADQELSTIRTEIRKGTFDVRNYVKRELKVLQFSNYAEAWLTRRQKAVECGDLAREYMRSVRSYVKNYMIPFFKERSIRDINEGWIEDFRLQLPKHLKAKTVANIMGYLRKMLRDAFRRRDIGRVPDFEKVEFGDPETRWIEEEDQYRVLAEVRNPMHWAFFLFLMKQAWRPGEARALRWEKVDFERGIVTCAAAMDQETYRPYTKERNILHQPIHPEVREALESLPRSLSGIVFDYMGKPVKKNTIWGSWRRAASRAGIDINCYQGTRHSLASQAINAGVDKALIGKFLGHKDPRSTERYAHLLAATLAGVWEKPAVPKVSPKKKIGGKLIKFTKKNG